MNVFFPSSCPFTSGSVLPDKLTVKMILEYAQVMSTNIRLLGVEDEKLYKPTHKNHPSTIWARQSRANMTWLWNAAKAMCAEYTLRYGKRHKTEDVIDHCAQYFHLFGNDEFTNPPQCMPDEFKHIDTTTAYRRYLRSKSYFDGGFRKGRDFTKLYLI